MRTFEHRMREHSRPGQEHCGRCHHRRWSDLSSSAQPGVLSQQERARDQADICRSPLDLGQDSRAATSSVSWLMATDAQKSMCNRGLRALTIEDVTAPVPLIVLAQLRFELVQISVQ